MSLIGPAISAIGSVFSGLLGSSQQLKQQREAQKWNQQVLNTQIGENAANRNFNAAQAELNRNFQSQMVDKANRYNSMENQVGQLRSAGLNPALAYSGNNFAPMSVPSGSSASSSGNVSPGSYPIVDAATPTLSGLRQMAEIKNIEAQTRKLDTEGSILESDAKFRDALNSSQLDLNNVSILLSDSGIQVNDEQIAKLRKDCEKLDSDMDLQLQEIALKWEQVRGQQLDNILKEIDKAYKGKEYEALIGKIVSDTRSNYADVKRTIELLSYEKDSIKSHADLERIMQRVQSRMASFYGIQIKNESLKTPQLQLDARHARGVNDLENLLGNFGKYQQSVTRYTGSLFGNILGGTGVTSLIGAAAK